MSFTQLASPFPVVVMGKGNGMALGVIDHGPEHELVWVSAIDRTGEIWCAPNREVRMCANRAMGRAASEEAGGSFSIQPRLRDEPDAFAEAFVDTPLPDVGTPLPDFHRAVHIPDADAEHSAFP